MKNYFDGYSLYWGLEDENKLKTIMNNFYTACKNPQDNDIGFIDYRKACFAEIPTEENIKQNIFFIMFPTVKNYYKLVRYINSLLNNNIKLEIIGYKIVNTSTYNKKFIVKNITNPVYLIVTTIRFIGNYTVTAKACLLLLLGVILRSMSFGDGFSENYIKNAVTDEDIFKSITAVACKPYLHNICDFLISKKHVEIMGDVDMCNKYINRTIYKQTSGFKLLDNIIQLKEEKNEAVNRG